jgi:hypothetical protein
MNFFNISLNFDLRRNSWMLLKKCNGLIPRARAYVTTCTGKRARRTLTRRAQIGTIFPKMPFSPEIKYENAK